MNDEEYIERLEKIISQQNDLITHFDAKFEQQDSLNKELYKQNSVLREDIKKHKDLLMDMNKTVNQHKNVVKKLKKELEDQLKIQQDLHKDYGEVIQGLTDELEEEKNKNNQKDQLKKIVNNFNESDLSQQVNSSNNQNDPQEVSCPNCGAEVKDGFMFCDSCGFKLN